MTIVAHKHWLGGLEILYFRSIFHPKIPRKLPGEVGYLIKWLGTLKFAWRKDNCWTINVFLIVIFSHFLPWEKNFFFLSKIYSCLSFHYRVKYDLYTFYGFVGLILHIIKQFDFFFTDCVPPLAHVHNVSDSVK